MADTPMLRVSSSAALTALVGSPCVSRVTTSMVRPLTPPAALISSTAKVRPRLKPMPVDDPGPVSATSQPSLSGPDCAKADCAKAGRARPAAAAARSVRRRSPNPLDTIRSTLAAWGGLFVLA